MPTAEPTGHPAPTRSRPARRRTCQLLVLGCSLGILTACGTDGSRRDRNVSELDPEAGLEHVHGLGVDPADGQLYAASHFGVFRVDEDGSIDQVADRWQDTMAFTVTGPNTFLGSGHPDLREDLPAHLGLIESTDAAQTWASLSLQGEADFHALAVAGPNIYGYDATSGRLMVTTDRKDWTEVVKAPVIGLAWAGEDPDVIVATTPQGLVRYRTDGTARPVAGAPPLVLIDSPGRGELVGITETGQVFASTDDGAHWQESDAPVPGAPEAFETTADNWYSASGRGIYRSSDRGQTWRQIYAPGRSQH